MTNKDILEKAIQKANNNGFSTNWVGKFTCISNNVISGEPTLVFKYMDSVYEVGLIYFIYNPLFAKALFGEKYPECNCLGYEDYCEYCSLVSPNYYWEHILQQMVISDDPIKYLGENL